ncbi:hypothetical protein POJ06DRAFT_259761 [Lipomyces tetrasporus]|uniref:Uncharacterized protein n=1 Tax=Lipomyces tetrasporus TaxID=54092 RepID=A0AAD7QPX8_9ASCO|nr:uncharacterized protein POJ06DRAFT_259761 [Lipomyces tetrasporus]KAJ8097697.1 hypothetical protein POJ06DRAFT_259761 [Lipomyces tetrasporus]
MEVPKIFGYIGLATSVLILTSLVKTVYIYIRPSSLPRYCKEGDESWAFVTGASDGIGQGFAQELCARGFNVFLHGRNPEKLLRIQETLRKEYSARQTRIILYDASKIDASIDDIASQIGETTRLTVLINNVGGMGMMMPCPYVNLQDFTFEDMQTVLSVNATFSAHITRVLLPLLLKNQPGLIINISSTTKFGIPWLAPYVATKAFAIGFGDALSAEMRAEKHDVEVLGVIVGSVESASNPATPSIFTPTSRAMASAVLDRVGCGELSVWGHWAHRLQGIALDVLSQKMFQDIATTQVRKLRLEQEQKKVK